LFSIESAPIPDVPVLWSSADNANCFVHMPLQKGDLGMAVISTRSLENYLSKDWKRNQECFPVEHDNIRHHDLSDAWFIPGVLPKNKTIQLPSQADDSSMVINNNSTTMEICNDGKIAVKNDTGELIDLLIQTLRAIENLRVPTLMGPQNILAVDKLIINNLITTLEEFKK
jgi:hypothetical protein